MSTKVPAGLQRIVVGVDGSEPSRWALRWAAALAGDETQIDVVIAWDYPMTYGVVAFGLEGWQPEEDAAKVVEQTVDELFGSRRPQRLETSVREGHPASVLLEAARTADLLVVGSRGHGGFAGLLLGSVSARCAEHARCAVLVAHQPPPF